MVTSIYECIITYCFTEKPQANPLLLGEPARWLPQEALPFYAQEPRRPHRRHRPQPARTCTARKLIFIYGFDNAEDSICEDTYRTQHTPSILVVRGPLIFFM